LSLIAGQPKYRFPLMYFWFCCAGRQSAKLMTLGVANSHRQMARPFQASAFSYTRWALAIMSSQTLLQTSFRYLANHFWGRAFSEGCRHGHLITISTRLPLGKAKRKRQRWN